MCGIAGILNFNADGKSYKAAIIEMVSTLSHRGPDGWGTYVTQGLALGHTRLSILDLESGDQPMMTERFAIIYNGEVYNYIELRSDLQKRGIRFSTQSDTEVVLRSFEAYGEKAFSLFNGQFAMAIWDRKDKRLVLARDRYGVRPLFILHHDNTWFFSSEMKAFDVVAGYHRSFDMENLFDHALLWNTIGDSTVFQNIRCLPPGTFEVYEAGIAPRNFRYYEIGETYDANKGPVGFAAAEEEFRCILEDSVDIRLRSDVPVGAYLSGGIDSSVIAYLVGKRKKDKLQTFSIAFEDKDYDESEYQREMVARLNVDHSEIKIDYEAINNFFLDAIYHIEQPVFRTAPVPLFLLSREVSDRNVKVVLTGEGADEILFGYDSFKELKLLQAWRKDPQSPDINLIVSDLYPHLKNYSDPRQIGMMRMFYEDFLNEFENELVSLNIRANNNMALERFFRKDYAVSFNKERLIDKIKRVLPKEFGTWSILQKNQFLEMKTLLSGYLLSSQGDRMSLAHGIEGRYPFLDHRVVELLFSYPDDFKLHGLTQKFLLKESFKQNIPQAIIQRPKKPYMAPDLRSFFAKGRLTEKCEHFLSESVIKDYGIFEEKAVTRFLQKFDQGIPKSIGYRDNMIITFLLSTQMAYYWSKTPKRSKPDPLSEKVAIEDF
jgi:asparagine synthase (glutamine-hydrolysing)